MSPFPCRFCGTLLQHRVVDLGMHPLCESYLSQDQIDTMEPFYPLHAWVCHECFLVQINDYVTAEHIFDEYAYFSSFSSTWLQHASDYVDAMTERLSLDEGSFVVELASNDGYLLQYFVDGRRAVSRDRTSEERCPDGDRQGRTDRRLVLRRRQGDRDGRRRKDGRPGLRRQRVGSGARPERLRRRHSPRS